MRPGVPGKAWWKALSGWAREPFLLGRQWGTAFGAGLATLIAGCATGGGAHVTIGTTLTPAQEAGLADVKAFVDAAARSYRVQPPAIMVGDHAGEATAGAIYRRGVIVFTSRMLTSASRDKVTAHELAHYFLRHDQPSSRTSSGSARP